MFGYSMVQMVRAYADKLEKPLRDEILNGYRPFKWTPCFLHRVYEGYVKKRKKLSLIVEFEDDYYEADCIKLHEVLERHHACKFKHDFSRISCCSAQVTPAGLEDILANCNHIKKVYVDKEVHALLDVAVEAAHAKNIVRNNKRLTGNGVTIAIIDTGIHPHQDLEGRIVDFVDFINERTAPYDDNGHGTHCAGDAAGDGSASQGKYQGPAPEANLVGVKVLDKVGSGSLETVMQGVEWCIRYNEEHPESRIDIISMSLGSTAQAFSSENEDPMVKIVEAAWKEGIIICVAAGNEGPEAKTIASPGLSDQVITVGALDDKDSVDTREDDDVASFSSRGPTIYDVTKPDILAPGVNIISLRAPGSYLDKAQKNARVDNDYFVLSGTSMATPLCAGVVALMKQHNPEATPYEIKQRLKQSANIWRNKDPNVYGAGYINGENAIN
ncbi:serine protease AprX [Thalassobacillus cyri]|uniref:Serine protease AprX n=1 Tax=Thalassobacillus cyri TaxID=571932 RepID=A0A1H3XVP1_9BACI|nr:S8 family peptidase [Thalassobacillus cyri]SEA02632.1 serine protease AprX [Thalassobacillus cyri]